MCNGEGQVTEFDLAFPEATRRANENKKAFEAHGQKTQAEILAGSFDQRKEKRWSKAPANCVATLVAFEEEWPECVPVGSKSFLYKTAKKLITEIGEADAPKFVHWASNIIKTEKPELIDGVKSLDSFSFLHGKWRREKGDRCPECGKGPIECTDEWGSRKRQEKYGADLAFFGQE